jgi:4-amino-4-deoxy-L-arabinose transferase-like glycosyltransferase
VTPTRRWWWSLVAILMAAAWVRLANLGTFSLWLDEVFTMTIADRPMAETIAACAADAENVPLYAVITNLGLDLGATETSLRLPPILAGLASIALLAMWVRRHFGPQVALLTAGFCALSTFHIRYSQELRSYPYLMLLCALALLAGDRLRRSPDTRSVLALAATIALGLYTHLNFVLILIPTAGTLFLSEESDSDRKSPPRRVLALFGLSLTIGAAFFIPWLWIISRNLVERMPRHWVTDWSWPVVGNRWQVWTIATWEDDPITTLGLLLGAIAILGLVAACKNRAGRLVIIPGLATIVGWELLMLAIHHWSNSRYNLPQWPFVAILLGLGFHQILMWLRWRWLQVAVTATAVALLMAHVKIYHHIGRPHWDTLAAVITELRNPDEPVLADSHWTTTCLSYYLGEKVPTTTGRPDRVDAVLSASPSLLMVHRTPPQPDNANVEDDWTVLSVIPRTATLARLSRRQDEAAPR